MDIQQISIMGVALFTSFTFTFLVIPELIMYFRKSKMLDLPDDRKKHDFPTPSLGGVAIIGGFLISIIVWLNNFDVLQIRYFFTSIFILFITGMRDDLGGINAKLKLAIQTFCAFIIAFGVIRVTDLHGFIGINELSVGMQYFVSILFIISITNAYNLIDGIDGLAGGLALINGIFYTITFYFLGDFNYTIISLAFSGSLFAFLYYNFNPAKIFMGDTGSLFIGFIISIMCIRIVQLPIPENLSFSFLNSDTKLIFVAATLLIPVVDMGRLFLYRISLKKSPFKPDNNHVHHLLINLNFNHKNTTFILYTFHIGYIVFASSLYQFTSLNMILILTLILYLSYETISFIRFNKTARHMNHMIKNLQIQGKENNLKIKDVKTLLSKRYKIEIL